MAWPPFDDPPPPGHSFPEPQDSWLPVAGMVFVGVLMACALFDIGRSLVRCLPDVAGEVPAEREPLLAGGARTAPSTTAVYFSCRRAPGAIAQLALLAGGRRYALHRGAGGDFTVVYSGPVAAERRVLARGLRPPPQRAGADGTVVVLIGWSPCSQAAIDIAFDARVRCFDDAPRAAWPPWAWRVPAPAAMSVLHDVAEAVVAEPARDWAWFAAHRDQWHEEPRRKRSWQHDGDPLMGVAVASQLAAMDATPPPPHPHHPVDPAPPHHPVDPPHPPPPDPPPPYCPAPDPPSGHHGV